MKKWEKPLSGTALYCTLLHFTVFSWTFLPSFLSYYLYFSSQPDGSPDHVTSVSEGGPAMRLPPVYVDGQTSDPCSLQPQGFVLDSSFLCMNTQ